MLRRGPTRPPSPRVAAQRLCRADASAGDAPADRRRDLLQTCPISYAAPAPHPPPPRGVVARACRTAWRLPRRHAGQPPRPGLRHAQDRAHTPMLRPRHRHAAPMPRRLTPPPAPRRYPALGGAFPRPPARRRPGGSLRRRGLRARLRARPAAPPRAAANAAPAAGVCGAPAALRSAWRPAHPRRALRAARRRRGAAGLTPRPAPCGAAAPRGSAAPAGRRRGAFKSLFAFLFHVGFTWVSRETCAPGVRPPLAYTWPRASSWLIRGRVPAGPARRRLCAWLGPAGLWHPPVYPLPALWGKRVWRQVGCPPAAGTQGNS